MTHTAPELVGDKWFGTEIARPTISDFRGRFLLLDFWTLCCVNCHHVLAELRELEGKFADILTVVGVHSPKFEHEKLPASVQAAIARHDIAHPVLNDPNMTTWQNYGVRAWPTLVLVDPVGEVIATYSGEGHGHAISALIEEVASGYEAAGKLIRGAGLYRAPEVVESFLRQPGKITTIPPRYREFFAGADLLVSNSGGHDLVAISSANPELALSRIGFGQRGLLDGSLTEAQFAEPYGARFLPEELAKATGFHLVVADTANHAIRAINLVEKTVTTIAGTGEQWMQRDSIMGLGITTKLSTPWDVQVFGSDLLIAMAGEHRLWKYEFATKRVSAFAGTTNEGLVDGPIASAWFAQPSALVASKLFPNRVWIIDAETSALRYLEGEEIKTVIGKGLFDFGHVDGIADQALLQHPLGAIELPDGSVLIADSYNRSLRKYSPAQSSVTTVLRDLAEPSDVELVSEENGFRVAVVEAAANKISIFTIGGESTVSGAELRTARPALEVAGGSTLLKVVFNPPVGQKFDERYGPSTQLVVSSTPKELLIAGAGSSTELTRQLTINAEVGEGVLHVAAKGASCDESATDALCHIHQQDWGIPVRISPTGTGEIQLVLSGDS